MKAKILLKYENKWVALNSTRTKVLYAASTINRLSKILSNTKEKNVILHYVAPFNGYFSPWAGSVIMGKPIGYSYLPENIQDPKIGVISEIYRPMIAIRISRENGQISHFFDALIDSGSDRNLFPMQFAIGAGIQFKRIEPQRIYGIGGGYIEAYPAKINIWLGIKKYHTEADFSSQQRIPLLGRDGFFNLFSSIKFDEKGQFVYIEE